MAESHPESCPHQLQSLTNIREPTVGDATGGGGWNLALEADCEECDSHVIIDTEVREVTLLD